METLDYIDENINKVNFMKMLDELGIYLSKVDLRKVNIDKFMHSLNNFLSDISKSDLEKWQIKKLSTAVCVYINNKLNTYYRAESIPLSQRTFVKGL